MAVNRKSFAKILDARQRRYVEGYWNFDRNCRFCLAWLELCCSFQRKFSGGTNSITKAQSQCENRPKLFVKSSSTGCSFISVFKFFSLFHLWWKKKERLLIFSCFFVAIGWLDISFDGCNISKRRPGWAYGTTNVKKTILLFIVVVCERNGIAEVQ